ncbi:hypothetical protein NQ317_005979 [Molorchus minor]|uniref:Uncharacterized protein n=1 Tax=Molorchus minor TaxID=1323400 RepID=A0ABQ9IWN3_9CUCU|nr:hypothetical protein NQ317_005979 [Molorchus minor]
MAKVNAKYSEDLARESLEWISAVTGDNINTAGDMDNFYEASQQYKTRDRKKVNNTTMAFKCMENINAYLEAAKQLGVPPQETFQTAGNFGNPALDQKKLKRTKGHFQMKNLKQAKLLLDFRWEVTKVPINLELTSGTQDTCEEITAYIPT